MKICKDITREVLNEIALRILEGFVTRPSEFPLENIFNPSATKPVYFSNGRAGGTQWVTPAGRETYLMLRPNPILGFDPKLGDVKHTQFSINQRYRTISGFETVLSEFRAHNAFAIATDGTEFRIDDLSWSEPIDFGRDINRGFTVNYIQLTSLIQNEFGVSRTIERNVIKEITIQIDLMEKAVAKRFRDFLIEQKKNPFIVIFDEKAITVNDASELAGRFYLNDNLQMRHTFNAFWNSQIKLREFV